MSEVNDTVAYRATDGRDKRRPARHPAVSGLPQDPPRGGGEPADAWRRCLVALLRALSAWPV